MGQGAWSFEFTPCSMPLALCLWIGRSGWNCTSIFQVMSLTLLLLSYGPGKWRPRQDLHPQPPRSKRDALSVELRGLDVRPGLAPGSVDLQTTGSASSPCARLKLVPSAGSAPAPSRSQREILLLHHEGNVEMGPPVGLRLLPLCRRRSAPQCIALSRMALAPTSACLQDRRLSVSATEE